MPAAAPKEWATKPCTGRKRAAARASAEAKWTSEETLPADSPCRGDRAPRPGNPPPPPCRRMASSARSGRPEGCVAVERGEEVLVEFGPEFRFQAEDAVYLCGSGRGAQ